MDFLLNQSSNTYIQGQDKYWNVDVKELEQKCLTCQVTNPTICRQICNIWKIKIAQTNLIKELPDHPNLSTIILAVSNYKKRKIIEVLSQKPSTLNELQKKLKQEGKSYSLKMIYEDFIQDLVQVGLVRLNNGRYLLTPAGQKVLEATSHLPITYKSEETEGKILFLLLDEPKTFDALLEVVPINELTRILRRLKNHRLITKVKSASHVLFFTTKRRPTRHLSPLEFKIFKSISKKGNTARELSEKVGIHMPRTYRYLRRLRYKHHVTRQKQELLFELTPIGLQMAEFLRLVYKVVQNLAPNDFA